MLTSALVLLPLTALTIRVFGLNATRALLTGKLPMKPHPTQPSREEVIGVVRLVRIARRYHSRWTNCLTHSLVLWLMLRRRGVAAEIRIGTQYDSAHRFSAHAWVEWEGLILNDSQDVGIRYAPFQRPVIVA
ncbi:MAG TPA: lasso peptide biosynthesis B2 protein [Roseimicrobium sp.]|nr:lasso peptide biosynthesis B2 protein [Roseimicrobium sp.]